MPYATATDGVSLYYKDWGQGAPILLIHGWPLTGDTFDALGMALVEAGHRVIIPDRRGFGRSDQPFGGHDYDSYARDCVAVLDNAKIDGPVAIAGFSMGGGEVMRLMTRHRNRVSCAVLISSVVPYMLQDDSNPDGVPQEKLDEMTQGMKEDRADFMRDFFKDFFGVGFIHAPVSDAVLHDAWRQAMMASLPATLKAAQAFAHTDFRPELAQVDVPLLVIHGTGDKTVPIDATARAVAAAVPHARLVEYDGSPHGVFATDGDRLVSDILSFLAEGPSAQRATMAEEASYG